MIDLTIVVVSFRSREDLPGLLSTVPAAVDGLTWRVVVVNNAPDEDLRAVCDAFDGVRLVEAGGNLGYSGGINVGIREAPPARALVVLNPDLLLRAGSLARLLQALDRGAGAAVPQIRDSDGILQMSLRREPALLSAVGDAIFGDRWARRPVLLSETVRREEEYRSEHPIEWSTGAVLAMRSEIAAKVGCWDAQRFFMYSEETDYARRIRTLNHEIVFVPDALVVHRGGGSGSSPNLEALLQVNKLRYYRKWHGPIASAAFATVLVLRNAARPHRAGARAAVKALLVSQCRAALPGGLR